MNRWVLESLGSHYQLAALPIGPEGLTYDWHCFYLKDRSIAEPATFLSRFLCQIGSEAG